MITQKHISVSPGQPELLYQATGITKIKIKSSGIFIGDSTVDNTNGLYMDGSNLSFLEVKLEANDSLYGFVPLTGGLTMVQLLIEW